MKKTKISKLQYNINNQKACYLYKKKHSMQGKLNLRPRVISTTNYTK